MTPCQLVLEGKTAVLPCLVNQEINSESSQAINYEITQLHILLICMCMIAFSKVISDKNKDLCE